jgi:hypothetical protein
MTGEKLFNMVVLCLLLAALGEFAWFLTELVAK